MKIVIVGGGWAGCAAALCAIKSGAEVILLERTDSLLGTGLVGGIMRNNGRFTAAEECIALGGGELFQLAETCLRHKNIDFPGHEHADLYDVARMPASVTRRMKEAGVQVHFMARAVKAQMEGSCLRSVVTEDGRIFSADVFVDATGTFGPVANCTKYGNGCVMCMMRCPSFGGRVSLCGLAGVKEYNARRADGKPGSMSGACKLMKESLSPDLAKQLSRTGVAVLPIPDEVRENRLKQKACQQYALEEFKDNLILLDTGHAKMMVPFFELNKLQSIPGFESARYEDPYAGGKGNSMRFFDMAPRDDALKVNDLDNVFCAGEKAGPLVGHTEAIATGLLAGHNAVRYGKNMPLLILPRSLAVGEAIAFVREKLLSEEGLSLRFTFSGSVLFERMKELGLYTTDIPAIQNRVRSAGHEGVLSRWDS
jgi:hypothetical protein